MDDIALLRGGSNKKPGRCPRAVVVAVVLVLVLVNRVVALAGLALVFLLYGHNPLERLAFGRRPAEADAWFGYDVAVDRALPWALL